MSVTKIKSFLHYKSVSILWKHKTIGKLILRSSKLLTTFPYLPRYTTK